MWSKTCEFCTGEGRHASGLLELQAEALPNLDYGPYICPYLVQADGECSDLCCAGFCAKSPPIASL